MQAEAGPQGEPLGPRWFTQTCGSKQKPLDEWLWPCPSTLSQPKCGANEERWDVKLAPTSERLFTLLSGHIVP